MNDGEKERLAALLEKWSSVQAEIKRAEQISRLSVGAAINELRYAGRVLVTALAQELGVEKVQYVDPNDELADRNKLLEKIVVAEQYLENAENDISDSLIYFFQKRVDDINARYGAAAVIKRNPSYESFQKKLSRARELVIDSRRDITRRRELYEEIKPIREDLIAGYFDLQRSDAFMAIELTKLNRKKERYKYAAVAVSIVAITLIIYCVI